MSPLTEKYFNYQQIIDIAIEKNVPAKFHQEFLEHIEDDIVVMLDEGFEDDEICSSAVSFAVEYIGKFQIELDKGHSKEWAKYYSNSIEEHAHAFNFTYRYIKDLNPVEATEELRIHCKSVGGDEFYTKHFIFLMEQAEALCEPDKQAGIYSRIYKEQLSSGSSELFAHYYADEMGRGKFIEVYNYAFAKFMEETELNGNVKYSGYFYASEIADYYSDHYSVGRDIGYDVIDRKNEAYIIGCLEAGLVPSHFGFIRK